MPIEPIDNPYKVLRFQKTKQTRAVKRRDPEEKDKNRHEQEIRSREHEVEQVEEETTKDETLDKIAENIQQSDSEPDEDTKPKLDIRI